MEFIPFKKNTKGHCSFSQQMGFFATRRRGFRSEGKFGIDFVTHFAATKQVYGSTNWRSCAKGGFRSCETPFEMVPQLRNCGSPGVEKIAANTQLRNGVPGCEMALVCQRGFSQRAQGSCEMVSRRRSIFAARRGIFAAAPEGCEIFSERIAIFAATPFWLRNFAA